MRRASPRRAPPRRWRARPGSAQNAASRAECRPLGDARGGHAGDEPDERLGGRERGALQERGRGAFSPASRREPPERVRQRRGHPLGELGGGDQLVRLGQSKQSTG